MRWEPTLLTTAESPGTTVEDLRLPEPTLYIAAGMRQTPMGRPASAAHATAPAHPYTSTLRPTRSGRRGQRWRGARTSLQIRKEVQLGESAASTKSLHQRGKEVKTEKILGMLMTLASLLR